MKLKIKKMHPDAVLPKQAKPGDSGLDLYALVSNESERDGVVLAPNTRLRVRTGIAIEMPEVSVITAWGHQVCYRYEGQVRPRSGLASDGIVAAFGTIDNGYRGEIMVTLFNTNPTRYFAIKHGERIAQLVIAPVLVTAIEEVTELSETERGATGFGSSGK